MRSPWFQHLLSNSTYCAAIPRRRRRVRRRWLRRRRVRRRLRRRSQVRMRRRRRQSSSILLSCERELSATLPSTRESKWLLANSKAMRQKSYGDERYASQEWGEALYHQNKRNSFLQDMHDITNDSWLSSRGTVPEADTKRTNELNTICTGLRISEKQTEQKEVVAPLPNMPVIGEFVKSCFNDQK
jgi:hypothetical protein